MPARTLRLALVAAVLAGGGASAEDLAGSKPVGIENATNMFQKICVETLPDFKRAKAILDASGFAANPETGTLYHPTLNLSFKVKSGKANGACSMVFVSRTDPLQLGIALSTAAVTSGRGDGGVGMDPQTGFAQVDLGKGTIMTFEPSMKMGGDRYYHAVISNGN